MASVQVYLLTSSLSMVRTLALMFYMLFIAFCRHLVHVHAGVAVHAEDLPDPSPGHQRPRSHRLPGAGLGHLRRCDRRGEFMTLKTYK